MVDTAAQIWRNWTTDGVPSSGEHDPDKIDIRAWGAWVEGLITAFTSNGGLIYSSKALLDADLAHAANSMAWVIGDATTANNGVYGKVGGSGTGSWTRRSDLPFSFIIATDAGAGTANAIQATTNIPASSSALVWMNVFETNTASPVTVSFNGGSALTVKNNSGTDIAVGGLTAGMIVLGIVSGATFRLVSDQANAAIVAAAQAILDEFRTIFLGAFAVAPTTDLEGNALLVGAQYFNTVSETIFTWNGTAWVTAADLTLDVPSNLTSSVQAPAITKANGYRWSLFAFNGGETERAKGSGHSTADFRQVFETALATGEKIDCSKWEFPIRSATDTTVNDSRVVSITADTPIDVEFARGAKLIFGAELDGLVGGAFSLRTSTSPSLSSQVPFSWKGGIFDASGMGQQTATGLTLLDIYQYTGYSVRDVIFFSGISTPSGTSIGFGKCDTAISTHNCFGGVVDNCDFTGFVDVGVYISGSNDAGSYDGIGEAEAVQNSRFRRCTNGINMKRDHLGQHAINNFFYECQNGILASPADSGTENQGETTVIVGNRFKKMQGRPIYLESGKDYIVQGNIIVDFGKLISDGTTFTTVSAGNRIAGVDLRGLSFALVSGNQIRQEAFQGGTAAANSEPVGIQIQSGVGGVVSNGNVVRDNNIYKVQRTMLEAASQTNNRWIENTTIAPTSGTALSHSMLGTGSQFIGEVLEGSVTTDLASLADGVPFDLAITVTGAAIGDWVESYSLSRDNAGLTITGAVTAANTVTLNIRNESGGAVDLANTIFKARVRRA